MVTEFAIQSPIVRRIRHSRYQSVDALVTLAVMAWFTGALALMVGEWHGAPSAPVARTAATKDAPTALTGKGNSSATRINVVQKERGFRTF